MTASATMSSVFLGPGVFMMPSPRSHAVGRSAGGGSGGSCCFGAAGGLFEGEMLVAGISVTGVGGCMIRVLTASQSVHGEPQHGQRYVGHQDHRADLLGALKPQKCTEFLELRLDCVRQVRDNR